MARPAAGGGRRPDRLVKLDAATAVPFDDTLHFMRVMWELVHALQTSSKRMQRELGVTGPQRLAIRVIGLCPGISPGGLARVLHVDPGTISGILKRIQQLRLVSRLSDPADRRRVVLSLTATGRRVDGASRGTVEAAIRRSLASARPGDRRATMRVLVALVARMTGAPARPRQPLMFRRSG